MCRKSTLLLQAVLAVGCGAWAAAAMPYGPDRVLRPPSAGIQSDDEGFIRVQARSRGGGVQRGVAGAQRSAPRANRNGGFNSNDFHQNVSNTRNLNTSSSRNVNVNTNRNVNVSGGGCCYGNYNSGPTWGGVAAGVAVGAMVGAAASSAYAPPPPTYPPGYVTPPPY
jgi:hypothetical protein